jgi:tetratricopeptide (TPR) repeat protein
LRGLGDIATADGDNERARSFYEQARAASDAYGDHWSSAAILGSLANLALTESRWGEAYTLAEESAIRFRAIGDRAGEASSLLNACLAALRSARRGDARAAVGRAAEPAITAGDPEVLAGALEVLAWLLVEAGRAAVSAESLGSAAEALERLGTSRGVPEQAIRDETMLRLRRALNADELEAAISRGRDVPPELALQRGLAALD